MGDRQYQVQVFLEEGDPSNGTSYGWNIVDWQTNQKKAMKSYRKACKEYREVKLVVAVTFREQKL